VVRSGLGPPLTGPALYIAVAHISKFERAIRDVI
jgi:hypothetical protein